MANKIIPPLDLMFFVLESSGSPKHVGAVQIFQKPANAPANYMQDLVRSFKDAPVVSPFNYRPIFPRFGLPYWQVDENLDIDYHVRHSALPQPGSDEQLFEVLARLHCGVLNRDRPCWISQIIEGLEGDRFAIYSKIHHAYIDGMSGVKRMYGTLSSNPVETRIVPSWSYVADEPGTPAGKAPDGDAWDKAGRALIAQARAITEISGAISRMGLEFLNLGSGGAQTLFHAPRTRMNDRVEYDTRAIATCSLPLDRTREIGEKTGAKVNDIVLAVIDAALHDYLESKGENTDTPLVALCPMSVRAEGDATASTQATALHVRLGEPGASALDRLQQVVDSSRATKAEARAMSREALTDFAMIMVAALELADRTSLGRVLSPSYNVLVSNVPGPGEDVLYLRGSRQLASYPISAFLPGSNLNVTVLSHGDKLDFGLVADRRALPDVAIVARAMEQRFAELEAAALGRQAAVSRPKAAAKKSKVAPTKKAVAKNRTSAKKKATPKKKAAR
jgi:diacylglycerol O-acyltransferase / wax synthase